MKRHPALVPLSHDHHRALVEARRLRREAAGPAPDAAAEAFLRFFADVTVRHFREEEELLFPSVVDCEEARELLVQALLEHQRLHALAAQLRQQLAGGDSLAGIMRQLGELLEAHVRLEERWLFPVIEQRLQAASLTKFEQGGGREPAEAGRLQGSGPVWGTESDDLNATLLSWKAGSGPPEHVSEERDVLVVVLDGSAILRIDGDERQLERGETVIIAKGVARKLTAGPDGLRYLSVHRRRPPLQIGSARAAAQTGSS
jgi:quercetin dioxygenase-like cupin family protein/iron-sulfur cluster repair protein YtfE (RIC family)